MLRFALVTYLSFTVVLGPGLCCCSAHLLFPRAGGSGCCSSPKKEVASHSPHSHTHHHHHGPSHHEQASTSKEAEQPQQPPCDHDQDCPCGRHQQTLFASQSCDGATVKSLDTRVNIFWTLAVDVALLNAAGPDSHSALAVGHARPGELFGRGILRAHHRLQC
jgi:hypothetical protein